MQDPTDPGPATDRRIRAVRRIGAILLIATGLVWIGQGIGLIPGSFMTGDPFWAVIGAAAVIIGILVARLSFADTRE
jgi:hypothetical protein